MGWRKEDTRIESLRELINENPVEAKDEILRVAAVFTRPSDRVRLFGLLVAAYKTLGDFKRGESAWIEGRAQGGSASARAELVIQAAVLHNASRDPVGARRLALQAQSLLKKLLDRPLGRSPSSRRRYRWLEALYSSTFCVLGDASLLLGYPEKALSHGLAAARRANRPSFYVAALSVIAVAVVRGAGSCAEIELVLKLCEKVAADIRPARYSIPAIKIRWIRGLCAARLGATRFAEGLLVTVVADLRALHAADADLAAMDLLWIVAERAGQYARARYLCRSLALPREALPPPPPALDEFDPPIGF